MQRAWPVFYKVIYKTYCNLLPSSEERGKHPNVMVCLKATQLNTTKKEKHVNHIYSTSLAKPIKCP